MLSLRDKFGPLRLERACGVIVSRTSTPSYQQIKNILEKNADIPETPEAAEIAAKKESGRGFQRGAGYFGGGHA